MIETAIKKGVAPRVELNSAEGFEKFIEMGVKHFNVGIDVRVLLDWYRSTGATMREALGLEQLAEPGSRQGQPVYGQT